MRHLVSAAMALAAIVIGTTACYSGDSASHTGTFGSRSVAAAEPVVPADSGGHDSDFCTLARQIGSEELNLADAATDDTDTAGLLSNIDRLDSVAPPDIKADFHYFDTLEHSLLDPAAHSDSSEPARAMPSALTHVSQYLHDVCGI